MRSIQYSLIVAVGVGVASGCAPANMKESPPVKIKVTPEGGSTKHTARKFGAPATYTGRLPCADCPGIRLTVTLLPDSTYRLRQVYEERPAVYHQVGRWSVDEKGTRLILVSGTSPAQRFQIVGLDSLWALAAREYNDPALWRVIAGGEGAPDERSNTIKGEIHSAVKRVTWPSFAS